MSESVNRTRGRSLLDSIRRTIEERNLLTARSRVKYVSAMRCGGTHSRNAGAVNVEARVNKLKAKVTQELITSEKNYLKQLGLIIDKFKGNVEALLTKREIDAVFGNVDIIKNINEELYKEMKSTTRISQVFQKYAPMLKVYSHYARNYQQALETLQAILSGTTATAAAQIIKNKEDILGLKLAALLITPIQRIPRYKLLLEQLLSFCKDDEHEELRASLETINAVALHMNEMVRSYENTQKILEIQGYFKKDVPLEMVQPGRWLIKHGIVMKPKNHHRRYIILFNDQLYFCKMKSGKQIKLKAPTLVPLRKSVINLIDKNIKIHCQGETPVTFTLKDADELNEWYALLTETINSLRRRNATLRKESSIGRPLRLSNGGTPGRLKRTLNISSKLDEIVDFLSPKKRKIEHYPDVSSTKEMRLQRRLVQAMEHNQALLCKLREFLQVYDWSDWSLNPERKYADAVES